MFKSIPTLRDPAQRRGRIKAPMRTPKREQSDSWLASKMPTSLHNFLSPVCRTHTLGHEGRAREVGGDWR